MTKAGIKRGLRHERCGGTSPRAREAASQGARHQRHLCKHLAGVALVAATLSSAGCGGGSGATASRELSAPAKTASQPVAPITSASHPVADGAHAGTHLIASADAICARINNEFAAERPKSSEMPEIARVASRRAAAEEAVLTELDELASPHSLASSWEQILGYRQSRVENLRALATYAASNDTKGVSSVVTAGEGLKRELLALASSKGFRSCSQVG
jgi:hypothetical protein